MNMYTNCAAQYCLMSVNAKIGCQQTGITFNELPLARCQDWKAQLTHRPQGANHPQASKQIADKTMQMPMCACSRDLTPTHSYQATMCQPVFGHACALLPSLACTARREKQLRAWQ